MERLKYLYKPLHNTLFRAIIMLTCYNSYIILNLLTLFILNLISYDIFINSHIITKQVFCYHLGQIIICFYGAQYTHCWNNMDTVSVNCQLSRIVCIFIKTHQMCNKHKYEYILVYTITHCTSIRHNTIMTH